MNKHIVCLALEVEDKYTAAHVKAEIEWLIPFISSELFDTLTGVYIARQPNTYVIWSAYKSGGCETYEELLATEQEMKGSISSIIVTHDIEQFVAAVLNEWDGDLLYHLLGAAS